MKIDYAINRSPNRWANNSTKAVSQVFHHKTFILFISQLTTHIPHIPHPMSKHMFFFFFFFVLKWKEKNKCWREWEWYHDPPLNIRVAWCIYWTNRMENGGFYLSITLFRIILLYMYANHRILKIRFKKKIHSRSGFIALPFQYADKFPQCDRIKTQLCALSINVLHLFLSMSSKQHSFNDNNNIKICKLDQSFGVQIENVKQKKNNFHSPHSHMWLFTWKSEMFSSKLIQHVRPEIFFCSNVWLCMHPKSQRVFACELWMVNMKKRVLRNRKNMKVISKQPFEQNRPRFGWKTLKFKCTYTSHILNVCFRIRRKLFTF